MYIQSLAGQWEFRQVGNEASPEPGHGEWLPAQVPGSVHTDLLALGRIPDPFVADNELHVQWVAECDWEYRFVFPVAPDPSPAPGTGLLTEDRIYLVCDGLDTLANVTLNGQPVGHAENMFRRYRWDVTSLLAAGENELRIVFPSPVAYVRDRQAEQPLKSPSQSIPGGPHLRKAPCQFGWDWGPQLPPIGIWKDIRLEGYSVARLDDVHLRQRHDQSASPIVTISAGMTVERWQDADMQAVLRLTGPDGRTQQETRFFGKNLVSEDPLEIKVEDPQLWWPNGYGAQPLYQAEVALYQGDALRDRHTYQLGLRTLELLQTPDASGSSFTFVVNGVPIFAKGANWIPADSFPTRVSDAHLEHLIRSAAQAHMTMLRAWGGGFYEEERFYDLCDRYGILVWQDFAFSCSTYPDDDAFFENVCVEAVENVRRLRHRASLALWCGNNEMEWGWVRWGWNIRSNRRFKDAYDRLFHHRLPEICATEDPDRPYWPSSPSSNTPFVDPNGVRAGDTHNWIVWHDGEPFAAYLNHPSRFVSEFGFQSLPPLETIRTYADELEWNMTSYVMEHHQRNAAGNAKIITYMASHFRFPKDFESLVYLTQLLQAEAVRTGVEHWRRNRHHTSGTLYWQLNDCWPVASWSSLDYFGRWKALHYAARRFYAPILLSAAPPSSPYEDSLPASPPPGSPSASPPPDSPSASPPLGPPPASPPSGGIEGGHVALHVTNDLTGDWQGTVRWSLETLAGGVLEMGEEAVTVPALSSVRVCTLDFSQWLNASPSTTDGASANAPSTDSPSALRTPNRREIVLVHELWQGDERISLGVVPFVPTKHLQLADHGLRYTVRAMAQPENGHDAGFEIPITARRLARFVWLALEGADVIFSDNYFDLPAGRTATVTLPAPAGWTADRVRASLRVRSLRDSF